MGCASVLMLVLVASCGRGGAPDDTVTVRSAVITSVLLTVRDANGGAVMPGISVEAVRSNGTSAGFGSTNASGQATFPLEDGSYRFRAADGGIEIFSSPAGQYCVTPGCTSATINISHVDVSVVDTSGAPVQGHQIFWETPAGARGGFLTTNASGQARFAVETNSYRFMETLNNFDFTSGAAGHCTVPSCTSATIVETLPVTVTVRDTAGQPVSGMTVVWREAGGSSGGWNPTNASGVVGMSVPTGSFTFEAQGNGTVYTSTPACVVPGCTAATITVAAPVTVTVRDTAGVAMTGKTVVWQTVGETTGGSASTNASGQVTLRPPNQPVRFRATVDTAFYSGAAGHCVQPGCTTAAIAVSQQTVVTVVDGSGNPISGRAVTPTSTEGITTTPASKNTNTSGQVTFRLPFAHWRFSARCTANNETFYSGDAGHCELSGSACLTAQIRMPCGQCTAQNPGAACDDQNACSASSTCQNLRCTAVSAMTCPGTVCADAGACSAQTGACVNPPKPNGIICDDGNTCTQFDVCEAGICRGPTPYVCKWPGYCKETGTCSTATPVSSTPPAQQDLIGWWHMDGDGQDASGNGHHLTVEGTVTPTPGRFGKAMMFDGTTSCMTAATWPDANLVDGEGFTLMAWVNHAASYTCPHPYVGRTIMGKGWDYSMGTWCGGEPNQGLHPGIAWGLQPQGGLGGGYSGIAGAVAGPNDWSLVTITWDRNHIAQFINGRMGGGYTIPGNFGQNYQNFAVGCFIENLAHSATRNRQYLGAIDEVLLYKRALTSAEIAAYYSAADPCPHPNQANGTYCYDNNACTQVDSCQAGQCVGTNPVVCPGADVCHEAGTCNPSNGTCGTATAKPDGTTCSDNNACTQTDACQVGVCTGANPVTCTAQDQCHDAGTCDPTTGTCSNPAAAEGATCSDGNSCTQTETCQAGSCNPPTNLPVIVNLPIRDIGDSSWSSASASDISAYGRIVGSATTATGDTHAFLQAGSAPMMDMGSWAGFGPTSGANAINDEGAIAGSMSGPDGSHAFRYTSANELQDLGIGTEIGGDGSQAVDGFTLQGAYAYDINNLGQLGGLYTVAGTIRGFVYTDEDGFDDVGSLIVNGRTMINAINDQGYAFGSSQVEGSPATGLLRLGHAVQYIGAGLPLIDLNAPVDPLSGWTLVTANDAAGRFVVGYGELDGKIQAYRQHDIVVDPITGGWRGMTTATGVNESGDVVGWGYLDAAETQQSAFVYTDQLGFKRLNDLIDPASHWDLRVANAINSSQEIVGWGLHDGHFAAFRLSITPQQLACGAVNSCGGGNAGEICLWTEGVVDAGDGNYRAVFSYQSGHPGSFQPAVNDVRLNGAVWTIPDPLPPRSLANGTHIAAYAPRIEPGQSISWTIDGKTAWAAAPAASGLGAPIGPTRVLPRVPIGGNGWGVIIGGTLMTLKADTSRYERAPTEPAVAEEPPTGAPYTGKLTGQFAVGPSGAAVYSVPIAIPPGVAGMAPNLSLVYDSQGGNGIAGQGWELSGLSIIHRCPKTRASDGKARSVMLDALYATNEDDRDGLCLDGRRLFETDTSRVYVTETKDFSRITHLADGSFTVETKSGETRLYGSPPGTGTGRVNVIGTGGTSQPAIWALDKVSDAWGNYFEIVYNSDVQQTGLRVAQINYTGHVDSGTGEIDTAPFHSVFFDYENRPDARTARIGSALFPKNRRLSKIRTPGREYRLAYNNPSERIPSQLGSITYCDTAHTPERCLDPLKFGWKEGSALGGFFAASSAYALPATPPTGTPLQPNTQLVGSQFLDLDGDGLVDYLRAREAVTAGNCSGSNAVPCPGDSVLDPVTHGRKATPREFFALRNTGTGWSGAWRGVGVPPPVSLSNADGLSAGTRFADVDGDGLPDIIRDHAKMACNADGCTYCPNGSAVTCGGTIKDVSPAIWLNRIPSLAVWQFVDPDVETGWRLPTGWDLPDGGGQINFGRSAIASIRDVIADMNGDGRADLVRMADYSTSGAGAGGSGLHVYILLNSGSGWERVPQVTLDGLYGSMIFTSVRDVNRDGLPDIVNQKFVQASNGQIESNFAVALNRGATPVAGSNPLTYAMTFEATIRHDATPGGSDFPLTHQPALGDLDGDGYYDVVASVPNSQPGEYHDDPNRHVGVQLGVGFSRSMDVVFTDSRAEPYRYNLLIYAPHGAEANNNGATVPDDFNLALVDLNGDGLADMLRNHGSLGGEVFINTGTTWAEQGGNAAWRVGPGNNPVPVVPGNINLGFDYDADGRTDEGGNGALFADLDGDGLADLIQEARGSVPSRAWLNRTEPPVIVTFPAPVDASVQVKYVVTSEATPAGTTPTYVDSGTLSFGTKYSPAPLRVVASVESTNGTDLTGGVSKTTYQYSDLRASTYGYGSQGFRTITITTPDNAVTKTTFAQAYPYTGHTIEVERSNQGAVSTTSTTYCTHNPVGSTDECFQRPHYPGFYPAKTPLFVRPVQVRDTTHIRSSQFPEATNSKTVTTTTETVYDDAGNVTSSKVEIVGFGQTRATTTETQYGTPEEKRLGKPTQIEVVAGSRRHMTTFDYRRVFGALALTKKKVEPFVSDQTVKSATAYYYDEYGNVTTSTTCAGDADNPLDFDSCTPGALGPPGLPYRTTTVSFDPAALPGGASLAGYGIGRFPVKTTVWKTETEGHFDLTRFDPLSGQPLEKTGPNGIKTCFEYDSFGRQTKEIARCDSDHPLETTIGRFRPVPPPCNTDICNPYGDLVRVITVTTPPAGSPSWVSTDALGRTIKTQTLGFDGDISTTLTDYDELGRIHRSSAPFLSTDTPRWTTTIPDPLGRPKQVTRDLGPLGDPTTGAPNGSDVATITYQPTNPDLPQGSSVLTEHTTNGESRVTYETKNVVGKVIAVINNRRQKMSYQYDDDGNLTQTLDPAENTIGIGYDVLGRKRTSSDPDMGSWSYTYDGFGDLRTQTDAKNKATSMTYDRLGRIVTKTQLETDPQTGAEVPKTATWVYDIAPGAGKGKLAAMVSGPDDRLAGSECPLPFGLNATLTGRRAARWLTYNAFGEVVEESQCTDGETFLTSFHHDDFGRQDLITYPTVHDSRMAVAYRYTAAGFLHYLSDPINGGLLWAATAIDASGRVTSEFTRNGVETESLRNPTTGWLLGRTSTAQADVGKVIQRAAYRYDEAGNLRQRLRTDEVSPDHSDETFEYDELDRLTRAHTTAPSDYSEGYDYDDLGNLWHKQGATYAYDGSCQAGNRAAGPHAVCNVAGGAQYQYDANGNMITGNGHSVTYTASNKPKQIASSQAGSIASADFIYGADNNRVVQLASSGGTTARTVYVGLGGTGKSLYERTTTMSGSETKLEHTHFIYAGGAHGGAAFAMRIVTATGSPSSATTSTKHLHLDHLGSVAAISDEAGHVTPPGPDEQSPGILSYDPWGARRPSEHQAANPSSFALPAGHREFTGHETIPGLTLVNMNGRIYDPMLGRFLSPDPTVQFQTSLQSFNRYSYVNNNPLSYTDPTGYSIAGILDVAFPVWRNFDPTTAQGVRNLIEMGMRITACMNPVACVIVNVTLSFQHAIEALAAGAPADQVWTSAFISASVGSVTGFIGGVDPSGGIIAGQISTTISTVLTNWATNRPLGETS